MLPKMLCRWAKGRGAAAGSEYTPSSKEDIEKICMYTLCPKMLCRWAKGRGAAAGSEYTPSSKEDIEKTCMYTLCPKMLCRWAKGRGAAAGSDDTSSSEEEEEDSGDVSSSSSDQDSEGGGYTGVIDNTGVGLVGQNHTFIGIYNIIIGIFGREITTHTVIYGVYIRF